jgi:hypothetical protein
MARGFFIPGECLVMVKGHGLLANGNNPGLWELGLSSERINVAPRTSHKELKTDDYGEDIPAELLYFLSDCDISMTLIHFDDMVLRRCLGESMAGAGGKEADGDISEGVYAAAGTPMGGWNKPLTAGNHYISLMILCQQSGLPWRFPTAYLPMSPMQWPLGTEKSVVSLRWRAIAYANPPDINQGSSSSPRKGEIISAGQTLWDHEMDTGQLVNGYNGTSEVPSFVSPNAATVGIFNPFAVRVAVIGLPVPTLTASGLPAGATFKDSGNGFGVLSGRTVFAGTYSITFTAANSVGNATQNFTLTVA